MGILKDKRSRAHAELARKQRVLARKLDARPDIWAHIERAEVRIRHWERERAQAHREGRPERVEALTLLLKDERRAVQNLRAQLKQLNSKIQRVKDAIGNLKDRIRKLTKRIQSQPPKPKGINLTPGSPHWGGSADIGWNEVVPAEGVTPHSTKRTETFGNPSSDHHVSQSVAWAGDFRPDVSAAVRSARAIGIPYSGYADDYKLYYIVRAGRTFRCQWICQNHGTGPHNHEGIERTN